MPIYLLPWVAYYHYRPQYTREYLKISVKRRILKSIIARATQCQSENGLLNFFDVRPVLLWQVYGPSLKQGP